MANIYLGSLPTAVFILMDGSTPVEAYTDKELAYYDCYICNEAEKFSENPSSFYVRDVILNTMPYASPAEA
jgi:hypothetical protein